MLRGLFRRSDGTTLTADEARAHLLDELAKGHTVLPMSDPACEGFSFTNGCPGHSYQDVAAHARLTEADRG